MQKRVVHLKYICPYDEEGYAHQIHYCRNFAQYDIPEDHQEERAKILQRDDLRDLIVSQKLEYHECCYCEHA